MYEDALHLIRIFPKLLFVGVLTILELLKDNLAHLSHCGLEVSDEDLRRMNITLRNETINVKDKSKVVLANLEDQIESLVNVRQSKIHLLRLLLKSSSQLK